MRHLMLVAFLSLAATVPGWAQERSELGSGDWVPATPKALSEAKSCRAAVAIMRDGAWGSSADTQLAPIAIAKCEKTFFDKLSPKGKKAYAEEMQLCAYEYAQQEGTMYMSAAALCQVDVAARFAAEPAAASRRGARASFDCAKAQTSLETAICSDTRLGHADIVLSRVYSAILKGADKNDKAALIQSERKWLQSIPTKCGLSAPPFSAKSLDCARDQLETRFMTLDSCEEGITDCLNRADDAAAAAPPVPAPRASFDCEAPSTALEIVICADAELGQRDLTLAQAYHDADTTMGAAQHKDLIESERQWLRFVPRKCPLGVVGGIPSALARACVRDAFNTRIQQLQTCSQTEPQNRMPCLNDFYLSVEKHGTQ